MAVRPVPMRDSGRSGTLPDQVASYVRELIMSGEVHAGEFLRMDRIAEAVGVSNTPVREGLLTLCGEGFVRFVPRKGFLVAPLSRQDIHDLFWNQAQIAAELAARAAKTMTPERLATIEAFHRECEKAIVAGDIEAVALHGHQFHRAINLAADSHRLAMLLGAVVRHVPNRFRAAIESEVAGTGNHHPKLIEAFHARSVSRVRLITEQHIKEGADGVVAMLEKRGMWAHEESGT